MQKRRSLAYSILVGPLHFWVLSAARIALSISDGGALAEGEEEPKNRRSQSKMLRLSSGVEQVVQLAMLLSSRCRRYGMNDRRSDQKGGRRSERPPRDYVACR